MKRRTKQNIIAVLAAAAGILLILGAVFFASKEHRYREYRNEREKFSIKYPANWAYQEHINGAAVLFSSPIANDLDFFTESVNVVVQDVGGHPLEIGAYSKVAIEQMEMVFGPNMVVLESGPFRLAGRKGYKFVFLGKGPDVELRYMCVWTIVGLKAYQVTYTALSSQYDRYIAKMKMMVKSFRIL